LAIAIPQEANIIYSEDTCGSDLLGATNPRDV
jgi:hypothetical protein